MSRELFKIAVCNIIKNKRKEMGLTVPQLAKGAKVCVRTLNYYEKCEKMPTFYNICRLAIFFKVPVDYFLYGDKK